MQLYVSLALGIEGVSTDKTEREVAASTGESQSAVGRDQTAYVGFYGL